MSSLAIVALAEEPYADHDGRGLGAEVRATGHDQGPGGWKQVGHVRGGSPQLGELGEQQLGHFISWK